jgi:hypothetical protein
MEQSGSGRLGALVARILLPSNAFTATQQLRAATNDMAGYVFPFMARKKGAAVAAPHCCKLLAAIRGALNLVR